MNKDVTVAEDTLIELLRQQRWSRVTLRYQNGKLGPIEISETVIIPMDPTSITTSLDKTSIIL